MVESSASKSSNSTGRTDRVVRKIESLSEDPTNGPDKSGQLLRPAASTDAPVRRCDVGVAVDMVRSVSTGETTIIAVSSRQSETTTTNSDRKRATNPRLWEH